MAPTPRRTVGPGRARGIGARRRGPRPAQAPRPHRRFGLTRTTGHRMLLDGSIPLLGMIPAPDVRPHISERPATPTPSPSRHRKLGRPMRKPSKRMVAVGVVLLLLAAVPAGIWLSLKHQPRFYRAMARVPRDRRAARGQAVRGAEPAAPQRHLQRAGLGGGLHRRGGQRLAGRGPGHPLRRPAPPRGPRAPRRLRGRPGHAGLPARSGGRSARSSRSSPARACPRRTSWS